MEIKNVNTTYVQKHIPLPSPNPLNLNNDQPPFSKSRLSCGFKRDLLSLQLLNFSYYKYRF